MPVDGRWTIGFANKVLYRFDEGDKAMRNLAIVSLTDAGATGCEVAALFGIRPEHASRLRTKVAKGSAALVPPQGRPPKLSPREKAKVARLAAAGATGADIATEMKVSGSTISRLLATAGPLAAQPRLVPDGGWGDQGEVSGSTSAEETTNRGTTTTGGRPTRRQQAVPGRSSPSPGVVVVGPTTPPRPGSVSTSPSTSTAMAWRPPRCGRR